MMDVIESPGLMTEADAAGGSADREQFRAIVAGWNAGGQPDTLAALQQFPQLRLDKSVILDLAYEEYYLRMHRGETVDRSGFCARFAEHRSSVLKTLEAHDYLDDGLSALVGGPTPWPEIGDLLGDYRIRKLLGRGGFARVYLADQVITGKQMVVKVAPANPREPRLMGRLEHPNVVPVHDARALPGGMCILVMPHVGDSTLTDLLDVAFPRLGCRPREGGLVARAAQRYRKPVVQTAEPVQGDYLGDVTALATELARGLAYLHANGVVHRDLKPTNVLLSRGGRPIILDFNLAEGREDPLQRGAGTLYYMAPEQIQAGLRPTKEAKVDELADLFSYGVIVYELLTGRHPFSMPDTSESAFRTARREEFAEWLRGQQRSGCLPIRTYVPDIDPAVERLVLSCLAFDSLERPASADAVVRELERIQGFGHRLGQWLRRRRKPVAVAACAAALALAGTAYGLSVRPPYAERMTKRARATLESGQASLAADDLDEALRIEPGNTEARFLRGMARVRLNDFDFAAEDFGKAWEHSQDINARVMLAYCMAAREMHPGAIHHLDGAMANFADKASLLNNRAFSNYRRPGNRDADRLNAVRRDLTACLEIEPNMAAAYLNRSELGYSDFQNSKQKDIALLDGAIEDIDRAIELGLVTGDTCYNAALFRVSHPTRRLEREQILTLLRKSREHGRDLARLANNPKFAAYFRDPDFAALLKPLPAPTANRRPPDGLVVPHF